MCNGIPDKPSTEQIQLSLALLLDDDCTIIHSSTSAIIDDNHDNMYLYRLDSQTVNVWQMWMVAINGDRYEAVYGMRWTTFSLSLSIYASHQFIIHDSYYVYDIPSIRYMGTPHTIMVAKFREAWQPLAEMMELIKIKILFQHDDNDE